MLWLLQLQKVIVAGQEAQLFEIVFAVEIVGILLIIIF